MRGFSSAERQAMARIASGKSVAGALQGLGKIMSPTGRKGAVTSGGAILGVGSAGVAVPMTGIAASAAGDAGVRKTGAERPEHRGPHRCAAGGS